MSATKSQGEGIAGASGAFEYDAIAS